MFYNFICFGISLLNIKIYIMNYVKDNIKKSFSDEEKKSKVSAAQIRIQKDITELALPETMKIKFPNPDDLLNFYLTIYPDEGFYKGGSFSFKFNINMNYPHDPPKVKCIQKIYHPNIDLDGNVCLNILREEWRPVLNLNAIVFGLQYLFLNPNVEEPLNKDYVYNVFQEILSKDSLDERVRDNKTISSFFKPLSSVTILSLNFNGPKHDISLIPA
ncbi:hypothetical protein PORY_002137 [Pneumocystis oryctolagi]|uniref:Uncharacterized protein n=1 Tax=Pneumocystis oryctolagi TaxID=42067 RepID=A0ACB7C9N8_9ASCO|nr:hypothetical protein PORY_002137 [Pneumocystis oryctolagi]